MERNQAAPRHSWARQQAWLLLRFFPFPVGHPMSAGCIGGLNGYVKTIDQISLFTLHTNLSTVVFFTFELYFFHLCRFHIHSNKVRKASNLKIGLRDGAAPVIRSLVDALTLAPNPARPFLAVGGLRLSLYFGCCSENKSPIMSQHHRLHGAAYCPQGIKFQLRLIVPLYSTQNIRFGTKPRYLHVLT